MTNFQKDLDGKPRFGSHRRWPMMVGGMLVVIIAAIAGAVIFVQDRINTNGKKALASFASQATGEAVTLRDFKVSILTGRGYIEEFHVPNSNVGSAEDSFAVEKIDIHIAPLSLIWGPLHVKSIDIATPTVELETSMTSSNLAIILAAAAAYVAASSLTEGGEDKLKVDSLTLSNVAVRGNIYPSTAKLNISIPSITMGDFGAEEGGLSVAEFAYQFINTLVTQVQNSVFH